ncbi:MAG: hypothetical protein ACRBDL_08650 [Alphaproteobacteria bacterium]
MKDKLLKNDNRVLTGDDKTQGAVFLAIAFAALVSVAILLYVRFNHFGEGSGDADSAITIESEVHIPTQERIKRDIEAKLPGSQQDMVHPTLAEINGKWFATFKEHSIAEITIEDGQFELIYTQDPQGRARRYSRGKIKYTEKTGYIRLYPSKEAGAPKPIRGVTYKPLTMRYYDIQLFKKAGESDLYFIAPQYQVLTKRFHPLFLYADFSGAPVLQFSPVQLGQ